MLSIGRRYCYLPVYLSKTLRFFNTHSSGRKGEVYKAPSNNDPEHYKTFREVAEKRRNKLLSSSKRFQRISQRTDRSDFPPEVHKFEGEGKFITRYRGFDIVKCPQDLVVYHQLFEMVKPKTIIELGSLSGGTAIWIADTLKLLQISCNIYSMDLDLRNLSEEVKKLKPPNVTFLQGDSFAIGETFSKEFISKLEHPWVLIEDAHVNIPSILRYFHQHCLKGDYMIIEDTNPHVPESALDFLYGDYKLMGTHKLNSLRDFLEEYQDYYAVDSFFTDMFGYNSTWHWHGFIRKMK